MSRTKRSFWKVSLSVFANVSYEMLFLQALFEMSVFANVSHETLILEDFGVRFCECLVRNTHFGSFLCPFLWMSRTKRSFWKISLSVFANARTKRAFRKDILEERGVKARRNAHFGRSLCQFLRMSRTKGSFWKISLSVFVKGSF